MFDILKSRRGRLKVNLIEELNRKKPNLERILTFVDEYESDNLATIDKLSRKKVLMITKINGALRNTIDTHGPITKELIGSASKRIYGTLLENESFKTRLKKLFTWKKKKK